MIGMKVVWGFFFFLVGAVVIVRGWFGSCTGLAFNDVKTYSFIPDLTNPFLVTTYNASIKVVSENRSDVQVSVIKRAARQKALDAVQVILGKNSITVDYSGACWDRVNVEVLVAFPNDYPKFNLETHNGSIDMTGVEHEVVVSLATHNGAIVAKRIAPASSVQTKNGSISIEKAGEASLIETRNGKIDVQTVHANSTIKTCNGAITIAKLDGVCIVTTDNGSISIDEAIGASSLHTKLGSIRVKKSDGSLQAHTKLGSVRIG